MPECDAFFRIDRMIHLPTPTMGFFDSLKIIELAQLRFVMRQGSGKRSHRYDLRNLSRNSHPGRNWPVLSYRDDERKDSQTAVHSDDWLPERRGLETTETLQDWKCGIRAEFGALFGPNKKHRSWREVVRPVFGPASGSIRPSEEAGSTKFGIRPRAEFHYKMRY